jgi:preprotein translocase subunit SecG
MLEGVTPSDGSDSTTMKRRTTMKTMQRITLAMVMVAVSLTLILNVSADDSKDGEGLRRARMEAVVDQYIQSREAKAEMLDSRCDAVRESARLSCDKAEFCKRNRDRLVNELMAGGYDPVPETVYPYLQMEFFETDGAKAYVRSR